MTSSTQSQGLEQGLTAPSRRSNGCRKCRAAKVKCGDQRPRCHRCVKTGHKCEYPDPLDLNFRNENSKTAARAKFLWRQRSTVHVEGETDSSQIKPGRRETSPFRATSGRSTSSNTSSVNEFSDAHPDIENEILKVALATFFQDFGCTSRIRTPWLEFFQMLPGFSEKPSKDNSPIGNIILAVALTYMNRDGSYPACEIMARTEYCKAISKINAHLQRQSQVPVNELLASMSLMGFFESLMPDLTVEDLGHGEKMFTHLRGAIAMVQMIEMQPLDTLDFDPRVLNVIYFQTVITCLRNRIRPPLSIRTWNNRLQSPLQNPGAPILLLMNQVACWQADMDIAMSNSSFDPVHAQAHILETIARLRNADIDVLKWESMAPPYLGFHVRDFHDQGDEYPLSRNHPLLSLPGTPRNIYTFKSCWATMPRMLVFVLRAVLHRNIVKCCTWMARTQAQTEDILSQSNISRNVIIDRIEQISSSVNSLLMDPFTSPFPSCQMQPQVHEYKPDIGKSMRLISLPWPVSVAILSLDDDYILEGVGRQRAQWLKDVLDYVHEQVGIRHPVLREPSPQPHLGI